MVEHISYIQLKSDQILVIQGDVTSVTSIRGLFSYTMNDAAEGLHTLVQILLDEFLVEVRKHLAQ